MFEWRKGAPFPPATPPLRIARRAMGKTNFLIRLHHNEKNTYLCIGKFLFVLRHG